MFTAWAALEGVTGLLRGQAMTNYDPNANPFVSNNKGNGDYVLIYPGRNEPIPSARLEELREGIEDWEILNVVRQKHGSKAVVKLLSRLFSTTATGAKLACVDRAARSGTPRGTRGRSSRTTGRPRRRSRRCARRRWPPRLTTDGRSPFLEWPPWRSGSRTASRS